MKVIRGLLTFIVSFILVLVLLATTILFTFKGIFKHQVITEVARQEFLKEIQTDVQESLSEEELKEVEEFSSSIDELINSEESAKIIDTVISEFVKYTDDNTYQVSDETIDMIINYCVKNKSTIEKISGSEFPEEEITSQESRDNLRDAFNEAFEDLNEDLDVHAKDVVKGVEVVISDKTQTQAIFVIIAIIVVLAILSLSVYKWLKPCGSSFITAGILVSILYVGLSYILNLIKTEGDLDLNIDPKSVLIAGLVEIGAGIAMLVVYSIIKKSGSAEKKVTTVTEVVSDTENITEKDDNE